MDLEILWKITWRFENYASTRVVLCAVGTERIRRKVEHGCGRRSAGVVRVQLRQVDEAS